MPKTFSKTQRWLLFSAAALALPSVLASWWMLASRDPVPASSLMEGISFGEEPASTPSISPAETAMRTGAQPRTADAGGTAAGKTEADDFQQYASALRAQGHPEATVRELTASRITAAFQIRRTAIRNQARQAHASARDIQARLDVLNREQGALIAQLVGAEEEPMADATAQTAATDAQGKAKPEQILTPAVLSEAMPATVKTDEHAVDWEKLRNDFVNAIDGPNQDPTNPQYRKRWVQAQSEADQRFRLLYGDTAFVQHQMQAQQEAAMKEQGVAK